MKARTRFLKMYLKLPEKARRELVMKFTTQPMTLNVIALEVRQNTQFGKELLIELGFEDE